MKVCTKEDIVNYDLDCLWQDELGCDTCSYYEENDYNSQCFELASWFKKEGATRMSMVAWNLIYEIPEWNTDVGISYPMHDRVCQAYHKLKESL